MTAPVLPEPSEHVGGWPWELARSVGEATPAQLDDSELPRITIVTPSYNQGEFLEECIRSVLLQGYPALDYYILDGGSTDGSVEIIRRYEAFLAGWRSEADGGQAAAIREGFALGNGELLGWLNSDDILMPDALRTVGTAFREHPNAALIYGDCLVLDRDGSRSRVVTVPEFSRKRLKRVDFIWQPAAYFPRSHYEAVGQVDPRYHWAMDWDLWLRLTRSGKAVHIDSCLAGARIYAENKTESGGSRRATELLDLYRRHGIVNRVLVFLAVYHVVLRFEEWLRRWPRVHTVVFQRWRPVWQWVQRVLLKLSAR